jgi:hypothetical protein
MRQGKVLRVPWVVLFAVVVILSACSSDVHNEPTFGDFPKLFKEDVLIVVSENASQVELDSAEEISAELLGRGASAAAMKTDGGLSPSDRVNHNLVVVGTVESNTLLDQVYGISGVTRVTADYPGTKGGILGIERNPWNPERSMLIVAGSDVWGVKAGSEALRSISASDEHELIVYWPDRSGNDQASSLGLDGAGFEILDGEVRDYFAEFYPGREFPIVYTRLRESEQEPGSIVIRATARVVVPSPSAVFEFRDGAVSVVSEMEFPSESDQSDSDQASALGLNEAAFGILDGEVRDYFAEFYPGREFPIVYTRLRESEQEPGSIVIRATARVVVPSPSAVFEFRNGAVSVVSEMEFPEQ